MRKYYVDYGSGVFANKYTLCYSEEGRDDLGDRISRKHAVWLARAEKQRRRDDLTFSGFADDAIYPAGYNREEMDIRDDNRYMLKNYIWERVE